MNALSISESQKKAGISRAVLYRKIANGELPARKIGRRTVIFDSDLEKWLKSLPQVSAKQSDGDTKAATA
jgi:excisionase family DNA binding protein